MENKTYKIIICVLVVLLAAALCVICFLLGKDTKKEEPKKDHETKEVKKDEKPKEDKPELVDDSKQGEEIKEVLFDTTSYGNDDVEKVELTNNGKVLVTIKGTDNDVTGKEVAKNVVKTFVVQVGQSDICEGNKRIMFVHKDGTASYLNIDELVCGRKIVVENLKGFKNIDKFEVKTVKYDGEPDGHVTYVVTKDGKKTDISSKID